MAIDKTNIRFIFGIILIVCGWIICFDVFMLAFGIAFFLLGSILVLFSKKSWLTKTLLIGVPIILWFVGFKLILNEISKKEAVKIIVPEHFSGQVRVVYGEKGGIIPVSEKGQMVLDIPENGILVIQPFLNTEADKIFYYQYDDKGVPRKINRMASATASGVPRPAGFFEGTMSGDSTLDYIYNGFFILGNDSAKVMTFEEEKINDQRTDSLVKISRGIK